MYPIRSNLANVSEIIFADFNPNNNIHISTILESYSNNSVNIFYQVDTPLILM